MATKLIALGTMAFICGAAPATTVLGQQPESDEAALAVLDAASNPAMPADTSFTVLDVKHLSVAEAEETIRQMFPLPGIKACVPLQSTNQLILRADQRTIKAIQELLSKIDKPAPRTSAASQNSKPGRYGTSGSNDLLSPEPAQQLYPSSRAASVRDDWRLSEDYRNSG